MDEMDIYIKRRIFQVLQNYDYETAKELTQNERIDLKLKYSNDIINLVKNVPKQEENKGNEKPR